MKILGVLPTVDRLVTSSKFRQLADHGSQGDVPGASGRSMTESLAEKVSDLHKRNIWQRKKTLRKTFPTPSHGKHQLHTALGHGHVNILEHTGFPRRGGVGDNDARRPQDRNAVNNPEAWIEGVLGQFCSMRDGNLNDDTTWRKLGLRQDLLQGLSERLVRNGITGWLAWWDGQAFFGDQANPLPAHKMYARLGMPRHTGTDCGLVCDIRVITSIFNDTATPFVWRIGTGVEHKCNVLAYRQVDSG